MKKLMSLLILLSVLVLPVLAGCPDTVLPVLPVSVAKAETEIGEVTGVEDAEHITISELYVSSDIGDGDELYTDAYMEAFACAPGAEAVRVLLDQDLVCEYEGDDGHFYLEFSEAGEHSVNVSGRYNGQWSDPKEVWRGEIKTMGDLGATTFTVVMPENEGQDPQVTFDWKAPLPDWAQLQLSCVDGETESALWDVRGYSLDIGSNGDSVAIPAEYMSIPGEYVLELCCTRTGYDQYNYTQHVTVPGTAPGLASVVVNNNEPLVFSAEDGGLHTYQVPVTLNKTGASKFQWYDVYYGDEPETEEIAAVNGSASFDYSLECYSGYDDRRIAVRAWVGDGENGVWTNWNYTVFEFHVEIAQGGSGLLPPSYTIRNGENGTVIITASGLETGDTFDMTVRDEDGVVCYSTPWNYNTGALDPENSGNVTLTADHLGQDGTYYVTARRISEEGEYSRYVARKFVFHGETNIPGPVITLLPEPEDGKYNINTEYRFHFEKTDADLFEYRWKTSLYKHTVEVEDGEIDWDEDENIVYRYSPAEETILCRARLADGTWTCWTEKTFSFIARGTLPQPGLDLAAGTQPAAGYDLDVVITACDTEPENVDYYYIELMNLDELNAVASRNVRSGDFTEGNRYTWHISGSMLEQGNYWINLYAYGRNGYYDAENVRLEFEIPEPAEPQAEGPELTVSPDEGSYYPGEVTLTAYASGAVQYRFRVSGPRQEDIYDVAPNDKGAGVFAPELQAYWTSYYFYVSYRASADGPWSKETYRSIYVSSPYERMPSQDLRIEAEDSDAVPAGNDLVFTFTPVKDTEEREYTDYLRYYYLTVFRTVQDGEDEQVTEQYIWPDELERDGITVNEAGDYQYTCPGQHLLVPGEYYAWIRAIGRWNSYNSVKSFVYFTVTDEALTDAPVISIAPGDHYINEWIKVTLSKGTAVNVDRYYLAYNGEDQYIDEDSGEAWLWFDSVGTYPIHAAAVRMDGSWTKTASTTLVISVKGTAEPIGLTLPEEHQQWKELTATLSEPLPEGARLSLDLYRYDEEDEYWSWKDSEYVESSSSGNTVTLFLGGTFDEPGQYRLDVVTQIPGYYDSEEQSYQLTVTEAEQPDPPVITLGSGTIWYDERFTFTASAEGADLFNYRLAYTDSWFNDSYADADENGTAQIEAYSSYYHGLESCTLEVRARINGVWSKWGGVPIEPQGIVLDPVGVTGIKDISIGEDMPLEITLPEHSVGFSWWLYRVDENGGSDDCVYNDNDYYDELTVQMTLDEGRFNEGGTYYLAAQAYGATGDHYYGTYAEYPRFTVSGDRLPGPAITLEGLAEGQEEILVNQEVTFVAYLEGATAYECGWHNNTHFSPMELTADGKGEYKYAFERDDFSQWFECRAKINGVWTDWSSLPFTVAEGIQLPDVDLSSLRTAWTIGEDLVIPVTETGVKKLELNVYRCDEYGNTFAHVGRYWSENGTLTVPEADFEDEGYYCISGYYHGLAGYVDSYDWSDDCILHFTGSRYTAPVINLPADGVWINDYNVFTFVAPADEYTADSYDVQLFESSQEPEEVMPWQENTWTQYFSNEGSYTIRVRARVGNHCSAWAEKTFEIQSNGEPPITFSGVPAIALFPGQDFSLTFTDSVEDEVYSIGVYPEGNTTGDALVSTACWGDDSVTIDTSDLTEGSYYVEIRSSAPRYTIGSDGFTFTVDPSSLTGPAMTIEAKDSYLINDPFTVTLQHEDDVSSYQLDVFRYKENYGYVHCAINTTETFGTYTVTASSTGTWTVQARAKVGEYWTQWTEKTVTVTSLGVAQYPTLTYNNPVLRGNNIVVTVAPATGTDGVTLSLMNGETTVAIYGVECKQESTATINRAYYELTEGAYVLRVSLSPATGYENNPVTHKDYPVTINCFTLDKHERTEATCTAAGNTEYWYCTTCGKYYADEDATQQIAAASTVIPAKGHISPLDHTEAKAATCTEAGNIEYWHCTRCDGYFTDADARTVIQAADIVIPALGHVNPLAYTAAKAATCTEAGNIEHWYCSRCDKYFSDEAAENEVAAADIVIDALGHVDPLEYTAAKAATCTEAGNIRYWYCSRCGKYFSNAGATTEIALADTVIPAKGHNNPLYHVNGIPASCTAEGLIEHWWCTACDRRFSDAGAETEISQADTVIPAIGHIDPLEHVTARPASCTEEGNIEYWHCTRCGMYFTDAGATEEVSQAGTVIAKLAHTLAAHEEEPATCTVAGTGAYWECTVCHKKFSDANGAHEINAPAVLPAGHKLTIEHEEVPHTCTEPGTEAYWECEVCHKLFADQNAEREINAAVPIPAKHTLEKIPAVAATCTTAGYNDEYWHCTVCGKYFSDENGEAEINKPEEIPASGHDWGAPQYTWSSDNKKCTAKRTCNNDPEHHIETENGKVTSKTTPATREKTGKTVYTATFTNPAFAAQTKEVTIPKLKAPVGTYTDKETGTYEIRADWTAVFKKPAKSKATVTIPDTVKVKGYDIAVTEIADKAFSKDKNLTTLTIGSNIKTIGKNVFSGCAKLKTVKGGGAVEVIKDSAFNGCVKLSKLPTFPKLVSIGGNAFKGCTALTKVTISASVNSIGKSAFGGCKKLKTITIKSTLLTKKNVKSGAFKGIAANATVKCPKAKVKDYQKFLPGKGVPKTAKIK